MSTFKKANVVMLATNKIETESRIGYYKDTLSLGNSKYDKRLSLFRAIDGTHTPNPQHLYIISDDEIKKGDYIYCTITNAIEIAKYNHDYLIRDWKKVIATTDTSLYIHQKETISLPERVFYLPQPSQQFIKKFVEEYNKSNVITDVLVEYELVSNEEYFLNTINPDESVPYFDENLKINPKDNSLNICFID